jgi:hypothetical protein
MAEVKGISNVDNVTYNGETGKVNTKIGSDFSSFLGETQSLDEIFNQAADKYNISVELLKAIGKTESNFHANAVSRSGAQGIMQLMPATAKGLGVTDSFDAKQNIMGGAKYISGLLKKYEGNARLALAAYNAGSGNVAKYGGIPPFEETQNYVKKVVNYMKSGDIDVSEVYNNVKNNSNAGNLVAVSSKTPEQSNLSYLFLNDGSSDDSLNDLNVLFSYNDYIKFIELFLKDQDERNNQEDKSNRKDYSTKDINYNISVLNLLKNQNL